MPKVYPSTVYPSVPPGPLLQASHFGSCFAVCSAIQRTAGTIALLFQPSFLSPPTLHHRKFCLTFLTLICLILHAFISSRSSLFSFVLETTVTRFPIQLGSSHHAYCLVGFILDCPTLDLLASTCTFLFNSAPIHD